MSPKKTWGWGESELVNTYNQCKISNTDTITNSFTVKEAHGRIKILDQKERLKKNQKQNYFQIYINHFNKKIKSTIT